MPTDLFCFNFLGFSFSDYILSQLHFPTVFYVYSAVTFQIKSTVGNGWLTIPGAPWQEAV